MARRIGREERTGRVDGVPVRGSLKLHARQAMGGSCPINLSSVIG